MGKTEAGQLSKSRQKGKEPAFQLSKAPIVHGHASPDTTTAQPLSLPLKEISPAKAERPSRPDPQRKPRARKTGPPPSPSNRTTAAPTSSPNSSLAYEDLGPLPANYGSQSLFLVARDPEWLFCYWDIDWINRPGAPGSRVVLKMFHTSSPKKETGGVHASEEAYCAEITPDARNWYIPAKQLTASSPRKKVSKRKAEPPSHESPPSTPAFYAEIGYLSPDGTWDAIARSNETELPSYGISNEMHERFATIPFHLAFQKMQEMVEKTMREGEQLATALARLQLEGRQLMVALGKAPNWTPEQRHLLAALLGNELNRLLSLSPEEIDSLLREQLKEHLASAEAALATFGEVDLAASLDSRSALRWEALEQLSSLTMTVDHAFWSSWLSSWKEAAGLPSSFSLPAVAGGGLSSESALSSALSSWLSSWSGAEVTESSFLSSWLSSWSKAEVAESSFLSSFLSSWPQAAGAGESAFWSSWLSSWSGAAQGWGESSGGVSSFNIGASWSAHPNVYSYPGNREFFMHVNAEVIFYGGTHPDATLWIDGKRVPLKPDGSFHFHFKFPDGDATIPIVAQSPDGLEQRSASLRLTRQTARRGEIGKTQQPEHLPSLGDDPIPHGS